MSYNHAVVGSPVGSVRSEIMMPIRAEFTTMSWSNYLQGFILYTPFIGARIGDPIINGEARAPFDGNDEQSFYRRGRHASIDGPAKTNAPAADPNARAGPALEARRIILDNLVMQTALGPPSSTAVVL